MEEMRKDIEKAILEIEAEISAVATQMYYLHKRSEELGMVIRGLKERLAIIEQM